MNKVVCVHMCMFKVICLLRSVLNKSSEGYRGNARYTLWEQIQLVRIIE